MDTLLKQRIEILAQELAALQKEVEEGGGGGGGSVDAYTKQESDNKFLSKTDAVANYQPKGSYATTGDITSAIEGLDVAGTAASGSYVKSISQVDGKINAVTETIDTQVTNGSAHPVTSDAVYQAIQNIPGGGGTSDYADLSNKPSINNHTLSGNQTAAQLGLVEDGGNYILINNIRFYLGTSAPTGNIPDGSFGLGW